VDRVGADIVAAMEGLEEEEGASIITHLGHTSDLVEVVGILVEVVPHIAAGMVPQGGVLPIFQGRGRG
jgi:hypothetical protein